MDVEKPAREAPLFPFTIPYLLFPALLDSAADRKTVDA